MIPKLNDYKSIGDYKLFAMELTTLQDLFYSSSPLKISFYGLGLEKGQYGISKVFNTAYWGFLGAQIRRITLDGYGVLDVRTDDRRKLYQFTQFRFGSLTVEEGWNRVEEYVQYQDDLWDDMSPPMDVSSILEAMQPTFSGHLKKDYQPGRAGNIKRKEIGEYGPEWIVRSKFEDELANCMLEKKSHSKGIWDMLDLHRKELHEQFSQILSTIRKNKTPEPEAPTFAITTKSGISTQDPPFPTLPQSTSANHTEGATKK
ncbi:hypothetical protein Tco_1037041 [Tanacetum coccineum]